MQLRAQASRQAGSVLLLILPGLLTLSIMTLMMSTAASPTMASVQEPVLPQTAQVLLQWAGRATRISDVAGTPPGLLPYPDRNGDGNYDGTADCLSGSGLERDSWRLGRLPAGGEVWPCEGRAPRQPETRADASRQVRHLLHSMSARDSSGELLWFAASINVLDDDRIGHYPEVSVSRLMRERRGWLTLCRSDGVLLSQDIALILLAPGAPVGRQNRRTRAPHAHHYLDGVAVDGVAYDGVALDGGALDGGAYDGTAPCKAARASNADGDRLFVAAPWTGERVHAQPLFNDQILPISRRTFASALAVQQARALARLLQRHWPPPPAANAHGRCVAGLDRGQLPLSDNAGCRGLPQLPAWLLLRGADGERPYWRQLRYQRDRRHERAILQFDDCAMRFEVTRRGVHYAPALC